MESREPLSHSSVNIDANPIHVQLLDNSYIVIFVRQSFETSSLMRI